MPRSSTPNEIDVLVVGGGPVGLALALELGLRGVRTLVVDQRDRAGAQPRAKTTNVRSMTHMRRWGIAEALRDAATLPRDYPTDIVFATSMFGRTLAVIPNAFDGYKRRDSRFPEPAQWVPQYTVEQVLRERLATLPCVQRLGATEFTDATQDEDGVIASLRDGQTGETRTVRAAFLAGCDGARSRVRQVMGARMEGDHAFSHNFNMILRIPEFVDAPPSPKAIMYWIVNPGSPGVISPLEASRGLWAFGVLLPPGVKDIADDEVIRRLQIVVGRPVKAEVLTRDIWAAHRLIADRYRNGRMVLAGDACHLHPPFGGYGMNLGIADGVDLGWKLAATVAGWGGEALLDSYETERRPVHVRTVEEAVANYSVLTDHLLKADLDADTPDGEAARAAVSKEIMAKKTREFHTLGVVLGSRYAGSPVIVADGTSPTAEHHSTFEPSARPGCLAPHAWLRDGASLYDRFGQGFTLLRLGEAGAGTATALAAAASTSGVPLTVLDLREEALEELYGAPLALVRPDQYVAWRGAHADAHALIDIVRGAAEPLLARLAS